MGNLVDDLVAFLRCPICLRQHTVNLSPDDRKAISHKAQAMRLALEWGNALPPRCLQLLHSWRPFGGLQPYEGRRTYSGHRPWFAAPRSSRRHRLMCWRPLAGLALALWAWHGKPGSRPLHIDPPHSIPS